MLLLESGELISCSDDSTIKMWDLGKSKCVRTLTGHTKLVRAIKMSPSGALVSGSEDGTIKTWDLETGQCVNTINGHTCSAIEDLLLM